MSRVRLALDVAIDAALLIGLIGLAFAPMIDEVVALGVAPEIRVALLGLSLSAALNIVPASRRLDRSALLLLRGSR